MKLVRLTPEPTRAARIVEAVLAVALGAGAFYLIAHLVTFEYGRDQGIYAVVAGTMLDGGAPYKDAWDFKPPGIYFIFAVARLFFGGGMHAVRILEALGLLAMLRAFIILSRRHMGDVRPGVVGWAVAVFAYVTLGFWHTAQPETFSAVALAWAWVYATHRGEREFGAWMGAGALYCIAALLKPPVGGGAIVSAAIVLWMRRGASEPASRRFGAPLLGFLIGGLVPLAITLLYFAAKGALGDLYEALFVFAPGYTALSFDVARLPTLLWESVWKWLFGLTPFIVLGLVPLFAIPPVHARERELVLHALGTIVFALIGVALQAKLFAYHFGAAVVLAGLLAGWGIWKAWRYVRHQALGWVAVVGILVAAGAGWIPGLPYASEFWEKTALRHQALSQPENRRAILDRVYSKGDVDMTANRAAAEWIAANTPEGSTLYIWGFEPMIYDFADRKPASRYIYNVPQLASWFRRGARKRLYEELEASSPAALIVVRNDALEHVTGTPMDSRKAWQQSPRFWEWMSRYYKTAAMAGDLEIFLRVQ